MRLVSVVIPAFNEEVTIPTFYRQLVEALQPLEDRVSFEFVFVNNGSQDGTMATLAELRSRDPRVQILTLSRNFGYQAAITAGLRFAHGDAVACIDSDGEDPPLILARLVETWLAGDADVVYGVRGRRPESWLLQLGRKAYYRVTRALADHEIVLDMAEFSLMDRRVRDAVLATRSTFPFVRGQVGYAGFRRVGIPYDRLARLGGHSHYNLIRAFKFGLGGLLSSSTFPLRLLAYGGTVILLGAMLALLGFIAAGAPTTPAVLTGIGFAAIVLLLWITCGIAVLAIYLARVYKDQVALPLYIVDRARSLVDEEKRDGRA